MQNLSVFALFLLFALAAAQDPGVGTEGDDPEPEECINHKVLNGSDRAQGNTNQNNVRCDQRDLVTPGWYRFQGDAGDRMPENQCVPILRCGTHAPGWLNGSHPTVDEGAVQRKVCYHWSSNCCRWSNNIRVRNCGGFFVYELQRTPACSLRYCGNAGGPTQAPPTTPPAEPEECKNYKVLDGADRAQGNTNQNNVRCDQRDLATPGWYRFQGDAGDRMPENQCVPTLRCGTHAPGWLNGSHPTVDEGAVQRKVCYHWSSNCCRWSNNIRVRNCGAFFVYELQRTPACSLRYCGNAGGPTQGPPTTLPAEPEECKNYKVLDGADRAQGNTNQNNLRCDQRDLATPGWYRFQGDAGDRMPENQCVPMRRCGTHAPGWLNGSHPTVDEGAVQRKVCYHWSSNCCRWSNNIRVRNCGGFFVYELQRTPACYLRYCGNAGESTRAPPTTPPVVDMCRHYKVLFDADRAVGNTRQSPVQCDRGLAPGWYRFQGDAGDKMPDRCVPVRRCGTHAPGWLKGRHPKVAEGVVERKVCYHWSSNCCRWSNNIKVRNCGGFFVYELQRTPTCSLRYCVNAQAPTRPPPTTPPVPFGKGFVLLCLPRGIQVQVPRDVMRDWGRVHLNDPHCDVQDESDTHVVLKTPLDGCGTVRRSIHGRTVYTNNVIAHPQNDDDDDEEGGPPMNFPFMCSAQTFELPTERADEPMRDATEEIEGPELLSTA